MPRIRLLASSLALAICSVTAAQAQQFSNVFSFGDSLSDAGNIAALEGFEPGNSFTTNPDPVSVQLIAKAFGFNMTNISGLIPGSNGTDYAYGGACVQPNSPTFTCGLSPGAFSLTEQILGGGTSVDDPAGYLATHSGKADPHALYTMWGGANDIFTYAGLAGAGLITPTQAGNGTAVSAATEVGLIDVLQHAGARNILVFNLPNIGITPEARETGAQVPLSQLSIIYNNVLNSGLANHTGIIPVNVFGLVNEVIAHPGTFGFTNVTDEACGVGSSSVLCGPTGDPNDLFHYADGANKTFFFADGVHPTGAGHALLAQFVLAEIAAPSYASMLAESPLQTFDTQNRALYGQMQADRGQERADGTLRSFATADYSRQHYDATSSSPRTSVDNDALVLGGDYYVNHNISFGISTTFNHQSASFAGGGGFQNNEPMAAAWGLWHTSDYWLSALGSIGQLNFNGIDRAIQLGKDIRIETGNTGGSHLGYQLAGGYVFHWDDMDTGPFAAVEHQRVRVGNYNENGSDSSTMFFGRQERLSTVWRVGWELSGTSKMMGGSFHPYARVAYDREMDDNTRAVSAGVLGMNGTFSMLGFQPDSQYWTGELGVAAELGKNVNAFAAYDGHFGDSNQRVDSFNLGLKWAW